MASAEERFPPIAPANHIPGPKQGAWTYNHYAALPDDGQRYEIIDGVLYTIPSPSSSHQELVAMIVTYLMIHIKFNHLGKVFGAPLDVELAEKFVLQPDVLVILNEHKERVKGHVAGPPDLVVEILEPHTKEHDRGRKYNAYARGGVREYWIVDPLAQSVEIYALEASIYHLLGVFRGEDFLPSWVIKDFTVRVEQLFI